MLTFAICEDEAYFAAKLKRLLTEYANAKQRKILLKCFPNGEALLTSRMEFDILLMDIRLPGENGMEITRQLREAGNHSQLIFITAYPEHVFHAFELDAVHYLLKPVTAETLFPALDKAVQRTNSENGKAIVIAKGGGAARIAFRDILYCEALNHQITIHTFTGNCCFFGSLDAVQETLDERFYRCHRSYLVNLNYVAELQNGCAILENGSSVLVARRKQQEFLHRLLAFCRRGPE